jgi:hypothetical protein
MIGSNFLPRRAARGSKFCNAFSGSFSFLLWVKKRLAFTAKTKFSGVRSRHRSNASRIGETGKAIVQLHRSEVLQIIIQHFTRRCSRRVKRTFPVLVVKSGGADSNVTSHKKVFGRRRFDYEFNEDRVARTTFLTISGSVISLSLIPGFRRGPPYLYLSMARANVQARLGMYRWTIKHTAIFQSETRGVVRAHDTVSDEFAL